MESEFEQIVRAVTTALSRRGMSGLLASAVLAAVGLETSAKRKRKNKKKKRKTCKPACPECQICQKRTCLAVTNGTPCAGADVCLDGECVTQGCGSGPACVSPQVCLVGECVTLRCGNGGPCRVFVTLTSHIGSEMGSLEVADVLCQTEAEEFELDGSFRAWLSAGATSPANRFTNLDGRGVRHDWLLDRHGRQLDECTVRGLRVGTESVLL